MQKDGRGFDINLKKKGTELWRERGEGQSERFSSSNKCLSMAQICRHYTMALLAGIAFPIYETVNGILQIELAASLTFFFKWKGRVKKSDLYGRNILAQSRSNESGW